MSHIRHASSNAGRRPITFNFDACDVSRHTAQPANDQLLQKQQREELQNANHLQVKKFVCASLGDGKKKKNKEAISVVELSEHKITTIIADNAKAQQRVQIQTPSHKFLIEDAMPDVESDGPSTAAPVAKIRQSVALTTRTCEGQKPTSIPNPITQRETEVGPFGFSFITQGSKQGVQYRAELFFNYPESGAEYSLLQSSDGITFRLSPSPVFTAMKAGCVSLLQYQFGPQDAGQMMYLLIQTQQRAFRLPLTTESVDNECCCTQEIRDVWEISPNGKSEKQQLFYKKDAICLRDGIRIIQMLSGRAFEAFWPRRRLALCMGLEADAALCELFAGCGVLSLGDRTLFLSRSAWDETKSQGMKFRPFAEHYLLVLTECGPLVLYFENLQHLADAIALFNASHQTTRVKDEFKPSQRGIFRFLQTDLAFPGTLEPGRPFQPIAHPDTTVSLQLGFWRDKNFIICGVLHKGEMIPELAALFEPRIVATKGQLYEMRRCSFVGKRVNQIIVCQGYISTNKQTKEAAVKINISTKEMLIKHGGNYAQKKIQECHWVGWNAYWNGLYGPCWLRLNTTE